MGEYVILGASRGIGSYLLNSLKSRNEKVIGTYCSSETKGDEYYKLDVTDEESVKNFVAEVEAREFKSINLIVCTGVNYTAYAHNSDIEQWKSVIETNLTGCFSVVSKLLPLMRSAEYGRIIFFSSVVPQMGVATTSAYSASKAALWGLSKVIAGENAKKGITSNVINLGYFDIGMIKDVPVFSLKAIKGSIPSGELGKPENILNTIDYIVKSDYLTGSEIDLNGLIR